MQESVSSRKVKKKGMSPVQSNGRSQQKPSAKKPEKENSTVVMLLPGSQQASCFKKPTCSVPETWGRMYDVLALRN
jgi:hypothetical protein